MRESHDAKPMKNLAEARLNWDLEKRLLSYVAAASAAGVAMLACPTRAQAKVIFTDTWIPIAPGVSVTNLDLDNDGIADFQIANTNTKCGHSSTYAHCVAMRVHPQNVDNAIWGTNVAASALPSGVKLGSQGKFQAGHEFMGLEFHSGRNLSSTRYGSTGQWKQTTRGFLGLKFVIQGQVHYGWARLSVSANFTGMSGAISGYAYETQPNTPITTGQENGAVRRRGQPEKDGHVSPVDFIPASSPGGLGILASGERSRKKRRYGDATMNSQTAQQ